MTVELLWGLPALLHLLINLWKGSSVLLHFHLGFNFTAGLWADVLNYSFALPYSQADPQIFVLVQVFVILLLYFIIVNFTTKQSRCKDVN